MLDYLMFILFHFDGDSLPNPLSYRRLVGSLTYLTITRPDIVFSVHMLSCFMHEPSTLHMDAALRVLRYLKGSPGKGILLSSTSDLRIHGISMLIGVLVLLLVDLNIVLFLETVLYLGKQRNRMLFLDLQLKLIIVPWPIFHVSYNGLRFRSLILGYLMLLLCMFIVKSISIIHC